MKTKFPEEGSGLDKYIDKLEQKFDDFMVSTKTIAEKIQLDTARNVRTNPLYIEMFSRITQGKFADVHMVRATDL